MIPTLAGANRHSLSRVRTWLWVALAATIVLAGVGQSRPALSLERAARQRALLATVQVIVPDSDGNLFSAGSGTVLDAEKGLILTNYHVMGDVARGRLYNDDGLAVIGVNPPSLRGTPILKFYARLVEGEPDVDLAVLEIVAPFDDPRSALPANLGLTDVERGASRELGIGDNVYVLGFPGLGGDTVTYTQGIVSGFLDDNRDGVEEWIKTDAEVNRGNSGGLAVNEAGEFIGVPSAGNTEAETAGKISLIRPGDMALTYYDAWTLGPARPRQQGNRAEVTSVEFGDGINRNGTVRGSAARFDSGLRELYAAFEYRNVPRAGEMTMRWFNNGVSVATGTIDRGRSETGSDWVSLNSGDDDRGLADGLYELELLVDGVQLYRGGVVVGRAGQASAVQLGLFAFALGVDDAGAPISPARHFSSVQEIYAVFTAKGLRDGVVLRSVWSFEGEPVLDEEGPWNGGDVDIAWLSITHSDGLPIGNYELEIYIEGQLAQSGTFEVTAQTDTRTSSVNVSGTVYDKDNPRRKVNGALVLFLKPGVTIDEWVESQFDDALVHASGSSTRSGDYQLDQRVQPGETYGVVVVHEDFQSLREESYQVPGDASDPFVLDVPLERR